MIHCDWNNITSTRFATSTTFITTLQSQYAMSAIVKKYCPYAISDSNNTMTLYSIIQIKQTHQIHTHIHHNKKQKQQQQIFQIS